MTSWMKATRHIEVDETACRELCEDLACLYVCPAGVYSEQNGKIVVDWAGCLECATCQVACPTQALHWVYPRWRVRSYLPVWMKI